MAMYRYKPSTSRWGASWPQDVMSWAHLKQSRAAPGHPQAVHQKQQGAQACQSNHPTYRNRNSSHAGLRRSHDSDISLLLGNNQCVILKFAESGLQHPSQVKYMTYMTSSWLCIGLTACILPGSVCCATCCCVTKHSIKVILPLCHTHGQMILTTDVICDLDCSFFISI